MPTKGKPALWALAWCTVILLCVGLQTSHGQETRKRTLGGGAQAQRQGLAGRDCLGCHKDFANKYMGMKNVHAVVKENKCESCHLRHGLVAKRAMKLDGNELCYSCHPKEKIGLTKAHLHTAVKQGQCILCHNPHASNSEHLLTAAPDQICYQCHGKAKYEQKVVHKVMQSDGCSACHASHGSDQPNLLVQDEKSLCLTCHEAKEPAFTKAHGGYP